MITAHHVYVGYGSRTVLQDVSFRLMPGSLCGILGANGSGKTTMLKCLMGILPALRGDVRINGKSMVELPPGNRARHAAYVPQDTKQFGAGTVFETVLLGRKPYFGASPSRQDITITSRVLAELELEDLAVQPVRTLSGGQRQRVCIAKALCQQTPIILLDEPVANLDIRFKIEVMHLLQQLAQQGKTILLSVHDISVAHAFCSDIILLKNGQIIDQGGGEVLNKKNIEYLYDVSYDSIAPLFAGFGNRFYESSLNDNYKEVY